MPKFLSYALAVVTLFVPALAQSAHQHSAVGSVVSGSYMETRTADVYTGQCFANGEVNLIGNEAIMAWHVDRGTWDGVALNGMSVAAVVRAQATLGDPYADPYPARAVVIADDQATAAQAKALVSFAHHMAGRLLDTIVRVERAPVIMEIGANMSGRARMQAGQIATIETRGIGGHDHICGNEVTFYPPLTETTHAMPAVALTDSFQGKGLGETWTIRDKRSAFIGSFDTGATQVAEARR